MIAIAAKAGSKEIHGAIDQLRMVSRSLSSHFTGFVDLILQRVICRICLLYFYDV